MNSEASETKPSMYWMVWVGILSGALTIQSVIGGGIPQGQDQGQPPLGMLILCIVALIASFGIRWLLLPRFTNLRQKFPIFIMGVAIAEGPLFFQMFLIGPEYPETQRTILILTLVALAQFIPLFAKTSEPDPE